MYGNTNPTIFPRPDDLLLLGHHDSTAPPPHLIIPELHLDNIMGGSSSASGCSSYGSPTASTTHHQGSCFIQRSISSHSLHKNGCNSPTSSHFASVNYHHDFMDFDSSSSAVRRVFSTGDLQLQHGHRADSPLSSESSVIIESMSKACKYSPEEKKERIERYRSKRNQRNFNKKIKYACRKTLADSRPRIRGRFARNDEIEKNPQIQWSNMSGEEDEDDEDNWITFLDAFSANSFPN